jgi:hypothetical protein
LTVCLRFNGAPWNGHWQGAHEEHHRIDPDLVPEEPDEVDETINEGENGDEDESDEEDNIFLKIAENVNLS